MDFTSFETRPYLRNKQARRILQAAKDVFIREGGAAFSARRVARAAKLSLGSVQHVFPTTDELVTAMLEYVNDSYEAAYRAMAERLPFNPEARLRETINYLLEDVCEPDMQKFWLGFWALSCHNRHAADLLRHAYRHHCGNVAGFVHAARPDLPDTRCLDLARQVVAMVEGTMLFARMSETRLGLRSPLIQKARRAIWDLIATHAVRAERARR